LVPLRMPLPGFTHPDFRRPCKVPPPA
jgi:hypothetical protein